MSVQVLVGDGRAMMATLPANSVHCVVTSPPYMGLRSYNTDPQTWADGWVGELGGEPTLAAYIAHMVEVFECVKRVLHPTGVAWLNLGDSYAGSWGNYAPRGITGTQRERHDGGERWERKSYGDTTWKPATADVRALGLKEKDLMMVPHRVAIALQDAGWWVRQDIIWAKVNPMPESIRDRCTRSHEYVFMLTKNATYYYDALAIAEPLARPDEADRATPARFGGALKHSEASKQSRLHSGNTYTGTATGTRNKRDVWAVASQAYPNAHFAVMPSKLVEPCILAGTSEKGCCPHCLAPWERVVERSSQGNAIAAGGAKAIALQQLREQGDIGRLDGGRRAVNGSTFNNNPNKRPPASSTIGWRPTCTCNAGEPASCTVLDPFAGSGTVLKVAVKHRRHAIGCELNPAYAHLIDKRLNGVQQALPWEQEQQEVTA